MVPEAGFDIGDSDENIPTWADAPLNNLDYAGPDRKARICGRFDASRTRGQHDEKNAAHNCHACRNTPDRSTTDGSIEARRQCSLLHRGNLRSAGMAYRCGRVENAADLR